MMVTLLLLTLLAQPQLSQPRIVLRTGTTCTTTFDGRWKPKGEMLFLWSNTDVGFAEGIVVYDGGDVSTDYQEDFGKAVCTGAFSSERIAQFKADLRRTKVCRRFTKTNTPRKRTGAYVDLGPTFKCHFDVPAKKWREFATTRAVQALVDGVRRDLCGGPCPIPHPSNPLWIPDPPPAPAKR